MPCATLPRIALAGISKTQKSKVAAWQSSALPSANRFHEAGEAGLLVPETLNR
jgi:hypothetical protein